LIASAVRCDDASFILEHKKKNCDYVPTAWEVDRSQIQVVGSFDALRDDDVVITVDGKNVTLDPRLIAENFQNNLDIGPSFEKVLEIKWSIRDSVTELRQAFGLNKLVA
jgi:hypothetical protein